jgi:hypothetical protein
MPPQRMPQRMIHNLVDTPRLYFLYSVQRYTHEEALALTEPLNARIAEFETELEQLR